MIDVIEEPIFTSGVDLDFESVFKNRGTPVGGGDLWPAWGALGLPRRTALGGRRARAPAAAGPGAARRGTGSRAGTWPHAPAREAEGRSTGPVSPITVHAPP